MRCLATFPASHASFFRIKFVCRSFLMRCLASLAGYRALLIFIHGSKATFALSATPAIATSLSIRSHVEPPVPYIQYSGDMQCAEVDVWILISIY
jgi:hypothetical protein